MSEALLAQELYPWLFPVSGDWASWYPAPPAGWRRQLMDLVTDSSEEMNEAIVHLV